MFNGEIDYRYGNWPTPRQELLVRAAVLEGDDCRKAWAEWSAKTDLDDVEYDSFRMLPLVYFNLSEQGLEDPDLPRLKGIFRRTWYKNQVLLNRLTDVLRLLQKNRIDVLTIKGAPLTARYYKPAGRRMMHDLDILVRPKDALRSVQLLVSDNWTTMNPEFPKLSEECLRTRYATHIQDNIGIELDVHWYALSSCCYPVADRSFWSRAIQVRINDVETHTLSATDHLLHVCVHGVTSHNTCPMRWITDALTILRSHDEVNWSALESEIRERHLVRPMRDVLSFLQSRFGASIPNKIIERLDLLQVRKRETWGYWATTRVNQKSRAALVHLGTAYLRQTEGRNIRPSLAGFFTFLKCIWVVDSFWQVPFRGIQKLSRRALQSVTSLGGD